MTITAHFKVRQRLVKLDTASLLEMAKGGGNLLADVLPEGVNPGVCDCCGEDLETGCLTGMLPNVAPTSPDRADFIVECGNIGCEGWYEVYWAEVKK